MPAKRKSTYKRKRRAYNYKPGRYTKNAITRGVTAVSSVPDRMTVKLSYTDIYSASTTTGINSQIFRGNGPFDPDQTGVGHQPRGFDQWAAFYDSYVVLSSAIRVIPQCNTGAAVVTVHPQNTTTVGNLVTAMERARSHFRTIQSQGNPSTKIDARADTKMIMGIDKSEMFDDQYSAAVTSNPIQQWYWHLYHQHPDLASASTVSSVVKITYTILFFNRKALGIS